MSWPQVRAWLDRLRQVDAATLGSGSSPEGARAAWAAALDAFDADTLARLEARGEAAPPLTAFIAASTVFTAPIEWLALQLGRGGAVRLKHPQGQPGAALALVQAAQAVGLPLTCTDAHEAWRGAELVVAMGSDETMAALRADLPTSTRFLPHGHRFSAAWVVGAALAPDPLVPPEFSADAWAGLAADLCLHDGRGCLSPQVVFTPLPLARAVPALAEAFVRARRVWPMGAMSDDEGAQVRARLTLGRVVGVVSGEPGAWVVGLPAAYWVPGALPGLVSVVSVANAEAARALLAPWADALSTLGTDEGSPEPWFEARKVRPGRMQRPPVVRLHDGRDWIVACRG